MNKKLTCEWCFEEHEILVPIVKWDWDSDTDVHTEVHERRCLLCLRDALKVAEDE